MKFWTVRDLLYFSPEWGFGVDGKLKIPVLKLLQYIYLCNLNLHLKIFPPSYTCEDVIGNQYIAFTKIQISS
jgi:hypothetical protein